jgi:hypothetical protein
MDISHNLARLVHLFVLLVTGKSLLVLRDYSLDVRRAHLPRARKSNNKNIAISAERCEQCKFSFQAACPNNMSSLIARQWRHQLNLMYPAYPMYNTADAPPASLAKVLKSADYQMLHPRDLECILSDLLAATLTGSAVSSTKPSAPANLGANCHKNKN